MEGGTLLAKSVMLFLPSSTWNTFYLFRLQCFRPGAFNDIIYPPVFLLRTTPIFDLYFYLHLFCFRFTMFHVD